MTTQKLQRDTAAIKLLEQTQATVQKFLTRVDPGTASTRRDNCRYRDARSLLQDITAMLRAERSGWIDL